MSEEVNSVERTKQIMGGSFWENSLKAMQANMRKQLEAQEIKQPLGKMLEQVQKKQDK